MDRLRVNVPRTRHDERVFRKPAAQERRKKKSKKTLGRHATKRPVARRTKTDNPQPVGSQFRLTLMWHLSRRLPWCWETGPPYSSERDHVFDMLETREFPDSTLLGGDVRLLKKMNMKRESQNTVCC